MNKFIIGFILGALLGSVIGVIASNKYESKSEDAASIVGYGYNGTTIVPLAVTADGSLIIN